jgi:hypothetical protein
MHFSLTAIAALVTVSFAQKAPTLSEVVSADSKLSDFAAILKKYPLISEHIGMAGAVTFFVPTNGARGLKDLLQFVNGPEAAKAPFGTVEFLLSYHVIHGVVPVASIPDGDTFAESYVEDKFAKAVSLVTGGQRVHIVKYGGKVSLVSGLDSPINVTQTVRCYVQHQKVPKLKIYLEHQI